MSTPVSDAAIADAYRACERIARAHDENFPTASALLPREVRRHVAAFYAFARAADDWADEPGRGDVATRRAAIAEWRRRLDAPPDGHPVFVALASTRATLGLDTSLFSRLLDAFDRDLTQPAYDTWDDVLSYCRDSADPIGRLVLAAAGDRDEEHGALSDRLCTALQLTNFWQDLSRDEPNGRYYLPRRERARWGDRAALRYAIARTRRLFDDASPLPQLAPPSLARWLRAVLAGGRMVLARVEALGEDAFRTRPSLGTRDRARLAAATFGPALPGSSFAASFLYLPPARREALAALHALCRAFDDDVDDAPDRATALAAYERVRAECAALGDRRPATPAGIRVARAWDAMGVPPDGLLLDGLGRLADAFVLDVERGRLGDDDALAAYCRGVGGGPGLAALPVFGRSDASDFALALGEALQRVNVLRDVAADARDGRIYVPEEDLARAAVDANALGGADAPPRATRLLRPLVSRARAAFGRARALVPTGANGSLRPALAMGELYESILERVAADPARVWRERVRPSPAAVAWIAVRARLGA